MQITFKLCHVAHKINQKKLNLTDFYANILKFIKTILNFSLQLKILKMTIQYF